MTDLRRLRDDLLSQARSVPEAMTRGEVGALLESYADSVALILERCGVVAVRPVPDTRFDSRQQQVSGVAVTGQPELDGTVASIVSDGYADADTGLPVAPARVIVYRHASPMTRRVTGDGGTDGGPPAGLAAAARADERLPVLAEIVELAAELGQLGGHDAASAGLAWMRRYSTEGLG